MTTICRELQNGVLMPVLNLGTYRLNEMTAEAVISSACQAGYKGFDCAMFYKNENIIGPMIHSYDVGGVEVSNAPNDLSFLPYHDFRQIQNFEESFKIPHGESKNKIFITTKIWPSDFHKDIADVLNHHLQDFQRDCTDLVLMHWPGPHVNWGFTQEEQKDEKTNAQNRIKVWRQLEKLYHQKKIRAIGVSNFMPSHLVPLLEDIKSRRDQGDIYATNVMINQVEGSPWIHGFKSILNLCRENNIAISAYRPLGGDAVKYGKIGQVDVSDEIAKTHHVPKANVLLRWVLQKGLIALPKSANPDRVRTNRDVFSFQLTDQEMQRLDQLHIADANMKENPNDIA